ncbi:hypothetical protein ACFYVR_20305 [Rhodococcus sp. NPDC003318]|uniref:hypothetical protein n=1 Tax=Rhodococcus sp. NPDC003318 TaxID=3364503 RepID=UPI0036CBFC06
MNQNHPTWTGDDAVSRAAWVIGIAAALVLGIAIGAAVTDGAGTGSVSTAGSVCATPSAGQ